MIIEKETDFFNLFFIVILLIYAYKMRYRITCVNVNA